MKRFLCLVLCITLISSSVGLKSYAAEVSDELEPVKEDDLHQDIIDDATATTTITNTVDSLLEQYKFKAAQGHGFAAERGNNLIDQIKGKNAKVVGDNNLKDGPDRMIINRDGSVTYIQDKYYKSASESVNAAFRDGQYRYKIGKQIIELEVPADQYEEAVQLMKSKISQGMVEGITDPEQAEKIVRKGSLSYKQAQNLAKAGTLESLSYDAATGVVSAGSALGISTVINYTVMRLSGFNREEAIQQAAVEGLETGSLVFCSTIISEQLSKAFLDKLLKESSEALVKTAGKRFANTLLKSAGKATVDNLSKAAIEEAAKILRSNAIASAVTMIVFTGPDAVDLFRGRISKQQFIKNVVVVATSIAAGTAGSVGGAALGNILLPGAGGVAGGIVGGLVGGTAGGLVADVVGDHFFEDDAEMLYATIEEVFGDCCEDYLVTEDEANAVVEVFSKQMTDKAYKDMYQSKDRKQYVRNMLEPMFETEIAKRAPIEEPSEEELRAYLKEQMKGEIFIH